MNYKMMGRFIARILTVEAFFMLPAIIISAFERNKEAVMGFAYGLAAILTVMVALNLICRRAKDAFYAREGLICVGVSWIVMSLLGCLPFFISGEIPSFIDAFFEIVSGFTTTGASILNNVEKLSKGMLYWRSFSHWLGGMGVLVFLLAIAPAGGQGSGFTMHLLRAESPGPNVGKLVPRMRQTAMILYLIYIILTVLNILFLALGDMPMFDAVCTAFGTAGTGGFGIKNSSIANYSPYIQNVCTVFMLLFGVNFGCYYLVIMRRIRGIFRDEELRMYIGIVAISIVLITINLRGVYSSVGETVRHAAFQVSSIMTTTGYSTVDFDAWPSFSKAILLCLMVVGACAGSTGGGMKCGRMLLLMKTLKRNINQTLHPNRVLRVRNSGSVVDEKILQNTNSYLAAYVIIIIISVIVVSIDGFSMTTNISAVIACFNNIGPGFDAVGPMCSYGGYSVLSKLVLIVDMLAGRLEIFPILVLFSHNTWKSK